VGGNNVRFSTENWPLSRFTVAESAS